MVLVLLVPLFENNLCGIRTNLRCDKLLEITHSIFGAAFDTRLFAQSIIDFHFDEIVLGCRLGNFLGLNIICINKPSKSLIVYG